MDVSSLVGALLSSDSVSSLGKTTKSDNDTVKNVLSAALPALLNGAKAQSEDSSSGFADAVQSHGKDDISNLAAFLGGVDTEDGGKIIGHLLGAQTDTEIMGIAKKAGASKKDTSNILSTAAPLLMTLLGQQTSSSSSSGNAALGNIAAALLQNVDVTELLGNLLGAGSNETTTTKKKKTASSSTKKAPTTTKKKTASSTTKKKTAASTKKKTAASEKEEENAGLGSLGDVLLNLLK